MASNRLLAINGIVNNLLFLNQKVFISYKYSKNATVPHSLLFNTVYPLLISILVTHQPKAAPEQHNHSQHYISKQTPKKPFQRNF
ncbi:MAG: hypothetical protein ACI8WB_002252 [Phenylobacterium sp.]|jgi:hypothetical protein